MEYQTTLNVLRDHAINFYIAMSEAKAFTKPISQEIYLQTISKELSEYAQRITTIKELERAKLWIPHTLLYFLSDFIVFGGWDYECGYEGFFDTLKSMLDQTALRFSWQHDYATDLAQYGFHDHSWEITLPGLYLDVDYEFAGPISNNIEDYLKQHGLSFYYPTTGDQTVSVLLVPLGSDEFLTDYLIKYSDPRSHLFYCSE